MYELMTTRYETILMRSLSFFCLIALPLTAAAQTSSNVLLGVRLTVPSQRLHETREVIVAIGTVW